MLIETEGLKGVLHSWSFVSKGLIKLGGWRTRRQLSIEEVPFRIQLQQLRQRILGNTHSTNRLPARHSLNINIILGDGVVRVHNRRLWIRLVCRKLVIEFLDALSSLVNLDNGLEMNHSDS